MIKTSRKIEPKKTVRKSDKRDEYMTFDLTAYNNPRNNLTKSGHKTIEGETIAADWNVLPNGTVVYIDGVGQRTVRDTGRLVKGHRIDVFMWSRSSAIEFGYKENVKVRIIKWGE